MKVLLVNGSPNRMGCTFTALSEVEKTLNEENIETKIIHVGQKDIRGCTACLKCMDLGKCVYDDYVNEFIELCKDFDGFIFGAPVYFASANSTLISLLTRGFYAGRKSGVNLFRLKPGAAVVSARRAGTTASIDEINKFFTISEMPIISSKYWPMVHGNTPDEVKQDKEGLQVMRTLGRNMAWFLKIKEAGKKAGISEPESEVPIVTNFIR